jgi:hypothetical protein
LAFFAVQFVDKKPIQTKIGNNGETIISQYYNLYHTQFSITTQSIRTNGSSQTRGAMLPSLTE